MFYREFEGVSIKISTFYGVFGGFIGGVWLFGFVFWVVVLW